MKRIFLLLITLSLLNQLTAQEIKVLSTFSFSSYNKFQNNIGYGIGYNQFIKSKDRLGFTFSHSFCNTEYNYIFSSDADGKDYYRDIKPKNQRLTFSLDYSFNISNKHKSNFFIGPKLGLNYIKINEFVIERPVNENTNYKYNIYYWVTNKIGIGLLLKYERKLISDKISMTFSTEPELIFFSKFGLFGSSEPIMIGWINFNLGVKFNLTKIKKIE